MNYLVSRCNCVCDETEIIAGARYEITELQKVAIVKAFGKVYEIDFLNTNNSVVKFSYNHNNYFLLNLKNENENFSCSVLNDKNIISIHISNSIKISINGKVYEINAQGIEYSSYEIFNKIMLIYFSGERDFVVVVKGEEIVDYSYYDECNIDNKERYFMCKLHDSLNHGKVIHIYEEKVENYLVYLDENDLCLKPEFLPCVFIDCLLAGNFKYCNNLLCESLKQKDEKNIKNFFCEFDYFVNLEQNVFAMFKKNTLAGIYKFEVDNNKIVNIVDLL